uniref:Fungal lipase-like domain-containing protein n=1 Tax=Aegilops tauschii subsp. strangulata TaxID=200361 RepID=A0A453PT20_AEGTS
MATATMATAAGAAALLYYTLNRRLHTEKLDREGDSDGESGRDAAAGGALESHSMSRVSRRDVRAPATWLETISTLSETLRFTYSETLGKWPIGDLAFGISFLLKRQGNLSVASIYAGDDSVELKGASVVTDLKYLLNLLTLCWHFSKKPFPLFLEATGYSTEDVLMQEPKAGILKPAFTILLDRDRQCILLLIRGTHSIRDTLTAATGAVVPFHHTIVKEGGVSDLVLGYAHFGMVAAARWIAKLATPCLTEALHLYPDYKIKVVGHSLGGGTAALLTYVLREQQEFASATCVSFAPGSHVMMFFCLKIRSCASFFVSLVEHFVGQALLWVLQCTCNLLLLGPFLLYRLGHGLNEHPNILWQQKYPMHYLLSTCGTTPRPFRWKYDVDKINLRIIK